jgi:hypothetical protein
MLQEHAGNEQDAHDHLGGMDENHMSSVGEHPARV